jgi:hypothetical protein
MSNLASETRLGGGRAARGRGTVERDIEELREHIEALRSDVAGITGGVRRLVGDSVQAARGETARAVNSLTGAASERPVMLTLVALAIGALIGFLLTPSSSRRNHP